MKRSLGLLLVLTATCDKNDAEKFADAYCPEIAKCCGQAGLPTDGKVCRQLFAWSASRGWYNGTAAAACLAETRSRASTGTFCASLDSFPSTCNAIFDTSFGNGKPGADCVQNDDCALSPEGEVRCVVADRDGYVLRCQVQMRGQVGDSPCVGTQDRADFYSTTGGTNVLAKAYVCNVVDGLRCANGACAALAELGESCNFSSECAPGAYCDPTSRCVTRVTAGEACAGVDASECEDGLYCPSSGAQQCAVRLAKGTACSSDSMCQSNTCANNLCYGGNAMSVYCGSK